MGIYRYAYVNNRPDGANRLLAQGWRPVREIAAAHPPESADQQVLALLERDDLPASGSCELLGGQVTATDMESLPLFTGLTSEELRNVFAALELQELAEGEAVFSQGETAPAIFIVVDGNIRISLPELPVEEVEVLDAPRLQVFGEASFFSGEPHATTAKATIKTQLLRLSRERFDDLLQAGSSAATKIAVNAAALLGKRLGATDKWVWELHQEDQNLRVARSWGRFRRRMYELG
jgi:CRP-like cAMP-binding protein